MDSSILSLLIRDLLVDNDRVSLPGIGSFVAEISPAYFSEDGVTINPPSRKVTFKSTEIWNDGLIEKLYAEKFKLDSGTVALELSLYFTELKRAVEDQKSIRFPEMGKLRSTMEGDLFFTMDEDVDFNTSLVGLDSISLNDLTVINNRKVPIVITEEELIVETIEVIEVVEEVEEKETSEVEKEVKVGEKVGEWRPAERRSVEKVEPTVESKPEPKLEPKLERETMIFSEVKAQGSEVRVMKKQKRTIVFLNFFVAMLILVLLILVFREDISNLIEDVLYTPQEIELLKQWDPNTGS